jgi:hypothetical protein
MRNGNAQVSDLIQSLPIGKVGTIHEVHHHLGAIAGEHRQDSSEGSYNHFLDEVIRLAGFEIHLKSVRILRLCYERIFSRIDVRDVIRTHLVYRDDLAIGMQLGLGPIPGFARNQRGTDDNNGCLI